MSKRIASLWLPHWRTGPSRPPSAASGAPAERPFALTEAAAGTVRLAAVSAAAAEAGLAPGMTLADARALAPGLRVRPGDPSAAARRLAALADWARRFAPWTAPCGADGLWLDITGCAGLFGGEDALLARLSAGVARRGYSHRLAAAGTHGAAWALARFAPGSGPFVLPAAPQQTVRAALAPLPAAALRLPAETVAALSRAGLRRIGDLYGLPRAPLARRFGRAQLERLDEALGRRAEPLAPRRPPERHAARRAFAEPVADSASISAALGALLEELCAALAGAGLGARRLTLRLRRLDAGPVAIAVAAARARRDAKGLAALFADRLDGLDAGFGVEAMELEAALVEPLAPPQTCLGPPRGRMENRKSGGAESAGNGGAETGAAALIDRLVNRLGADRVARLGPRGTHIPDRAVRRLPPLPEPGATAEWPADERPIRLFPRPRPVAAVAAAPDGPPMLFRWNGRTVRVVRAGGPERIAGEWWRGDSPTRDYYRVEDAQGARFWIFREGFYGAAPDGRGGPRWYLHGLFA